MITFDPGEGQPEKWVVCFCRKSARAWMDRLPIGTFKHVRAFGCVSHIRTWVFFDPAWDKTTIRIARGDAADALALKFMSESAVLVMPNNGELAMRPHLGGWCVPAVKQLLGLRSGALLPTTLFEHCLKSGGEVLKDRLDEPSGALREIA